MSDALLRAISRFTRLAARDPGFTASVTDQSGLGPADEVGDATAQEMDALIEELVSEKGTEIVLAAVLEWLCDLHEQATGNVQ